jgi:hypothetical protein
MMLEAGSNTRVKNKGGLTAYQLVDPANKELRDLIQKHEYTALNQGDFINVAAPTKGAPAVPAEAESDDDDAEFSGSDEEERAEWERRRRDKRGKKG